MTYMSKIKLWNEHNELLHAKQQLLPLENAKGHFAKWYLEYMGYAGSKLKDFNRILEQKYNVNIINLLKFCYCILINFFLQLDEQSIRCFVYLQSIDEKEFKENQKSYDEILLPARRLIDQIHQSENKLNVNSKNIFDQTPTAILLRISSSDQDLKSFQLDSNEVTVGRAKENSVVIADVLISRKHAVFRQDKGQWTVESVGMNGVAVNNIIVGLPLDHNRLKNGPID